MKRFLYTIFLPLLFVPNVYASCGLKGCPIIKPYGFTADIHGLFGSVEAGGPDASYESILTKIGFSPAEWLTTAVTIPFGSVQLNGNSESGISDTSIDALGRLFQTTSQELWLGFQMEFPTGDENKMLGAGHYGLLPYVTYKYHLKPLMFYGQSGARIALNEPTFTTPPPIDGSVFDPHADREVVYRLGAEGSLPAGFGWGLAFAGQTVVQQEERGTTFLSVIPELSYSILENLMVQIHGEIPVSSDKRFNWRLGAGLSYLF